MNNIVIDQGARDKIKYELGINLLVEAGAGSGKTTSLVERMVQLICTRTCTIDQIVAITFTKKAADELKVRFQSKLEKTWKEEQNDDVKYYLSEAIQNIERCFLGTVHSFCAKLLRERPIEANLDLAFTELEEAADTELLEEAWHIFLQKLQNEQSSLLEEMNQLGFSVANLFENLCQMKEYPDVEWVHDNTAEKPELVSAYHSLMAVMNEAKGSISKREPERGYDSLQTAIINANKKNRFLNPSKDKEIISLFELFDKNLKPTLNRWNTNEDAKYYEEKINEVVDKYIKPLLQEWKEYCHPKVVSFLQEGMQTYIQLKKERSLLNFQDLLLNAANLLRENAEVRQYFQTKYRCLLVDEFQDTDPIQAEIMFYLTSEDPAEKIWTKCKPKNGSLFVVGDPKQAIYRFRRADIDTYNRVKKLIEEHGGKVLQLTMNFRTVDAVTEELNKVFHSHLPEAATLYQAAYHPLHSFNKVNGAALAGIKKLTVPAEVTKKDDIIDIDSEQIASAIGQLISQGYNPRDFMVLTRYTEGIAIYAEKIEANGIPVSISGEVIIGEMREFQELCILLQTFIDPTDEVSLLATLRGIFFGISDDELFQWKMNGGVFSLYSEIPATLSVKVRDKLESAISKLREYQKWVRVYSPTIAIEKITEDTGLYILLIQNQRNKQIYKSLLQIFEGLRKREMDGQSTYKQVFELLTEMVYNKTTVINIEEEADAVRVMNVHKAKGLEAKIVFLAHPFKLVDPESFLSKHIKREGYTSKGYFSFTVKKGFQSKDIALPKDWADYKKEELQYLNAEELRILYVAATRPEMALIISSSAKSDKKNPWNLLFEIENIEEFPIQEIDMEVVVRELEEVNKTNYQSQTSELQAWVEGRKEKSYDYWSPTKEKDYSKVVTIEREEGGGKNWGTIIHQVYEKVVKGNDVTNYIPSLLNQFDFPLEKETEVRQAIDALKRSDFWSELPSAELVLTEVPFTITVSKDNHLYEWIDSSGNSSHPYIVKGVIDLIYNINGVWKIVDYKTDNPADPEHFKLLADFYHDQISFYKLAWEEMTGEKVVSEKLFFVKENI
ncbi:UvrD-helicase domain-containing protein [Neobacillus massiliamazoniensis]|uniref:DNA 3'-5' helicase n=1 Tax=Neobacillus massiliamazoniensis TaxID=1499688 RepID=A0A0U1NQB2_9BACI|nr:UvrD-helicase domain-containing protein [Neobacillus massiliamazoniensis]CRK80236.1 exodeoxyribonuclease V [Neobacillus massiliamazoniensis]